MALGIPHPNYNGQLHDCILPRVLPIRGGPEKTERHTSHNMWMQSVYEKFSQDHNTFWFSCLFSRAHFERLCGDPTFSIIQLTLSMRILYTRNQLVTMRIDKLKWITAHNCGKPKWHSFTPSLNWNGKIVGPRHCLTKCALENKTTGPKLLIFASIFSGEVTTYTDTSYCIHILWEVYAVPFFYGPPCITCNLTSVGNRNRQWCCTTCMMWAGFWFSPDFAKVRIQQINNREFGTMCVLIASSEQHFWNHQQVRVVVSE